jgi:ornithine--oxo-acid transaminase
MANANVVNSARLGFTELPDDIIFGYESTFGANHYTRQKVVVRKALGAWLYTEDGKKYLDCLAAYSAANQGHHHPRIVQAVVQALQGSYGSVISNVMYTDSLATFLKKLATLVPQLGPRFGNNGNKVLPKNGGVESVETAIKAARYFGWKHKGIEDGKQEIIVFDNNFHGRMITVVSFSTSRKYKEGFGPLTPGFVSCEFGNVEQVKKAINKNTCAVLVEPAQGEGGMYHPQSGFLSSLRELCDKHDLLLLFDEIQVGLGRTGKMFYMEHEGVTPDGVILGKALSGGLVPLSCYVTNRELMDLVFKPGTDGSTFGGYPLACVAGCTALDVLVEEKLPENSARIGAYLLEKLQSELAGSPQIKEIRGKGLFIGVEVNNGDAMHYCRQMLNHGLLANDSHGHTIRISPPLIIGENEADLIVDGLKAVLK